MNSRKIMTVLAVLIVLSLVVMPATAFAQSPTKVVGEARITKHVYPGNNFEFRINAKKLNKWPYVTGWVYKRNLSNNKVQRIGYTSCVKLKEGKAFVGGRGKGKWRGYYVMIAIHDNDGNDKLWIRKTKSKKFFNKWCKRPTNWTTEHRWDIVSGNLAVK
ncbi:hypothetical protein ACFLUM_01160 [Chloroflexota bacterium]